MGLFDIFRKKKPELTGEDLKWNKMWDLWTKGEAASPYAELMTYQAEVCNGGHAQYFSNVENLGDPAQELTVLKQILSARLKENAENAYKAYRVLEENPRDEEAETILAQCDGIFYENEAEIDRALEEYAAGMTL